TYISFGISSSIVASPAGGILSVVISFSPQGNAASPPNGINSVQFKSGPVGAEKFTAVSVFKWPVSSSGPLSVAPGLLLRIVRRWRPGLGGEDRSIILAVEAAELKLSCDSAILV